MMMTPHRIHSHAELLARMRERPDAAAKLSGNPGYPSDRLDAQQLQGAILGSPHPHARILGIDTHAARALPGVHAVVTAADIPGQACFGLRVVDRPVLCADKVRCIGDPIAAVAAESLALARQALALIEVRYELLPLVDDAEAALQPGAALLHGESSNLLHAHRHARGDIAAARAACAHWVDATYELPRQMHTYLETEGGVVEPDGAGGWVVHFGCHNPAGNAQFIAAMLGLDAQQVRAIGTPVGGSYGGKDELTIQPIAALLAWKSKRAVRLQLSRGESVDLGVKRHAMRIRMRSGCDAQGRLRLQQVDIIADTGAYATHGPEVLDAAVEHAVGPYRYDAVAIEARLAYTNNGIAGAFRGFGAVQTQVALEQQIEQLALACGMDAGEFRSINLAAPDAPGPLGQVVAPFDGPQRALDVIRAHPLWLGRRRWREGRWQRGVGLALVHRSDGFGRGGPNGTQFALALAVDGRIELRSSFTELGQNLVGALQALMVQQLSCAETDVRPVLGDSALAPDSGPVAASRCTTLAQRALAHHAGPWRERLLVLGARQLGCATEALRLGQGGLVDVRGSLRLSYADLARALGEAQLPVELITLPAEETPSEVEAAHFVFGACAALAQVAIDAWTGALRVERLVIAAALGPVVSAQGYIGQLEGGALMGQGLVSGEVLDMQGGRYLARNLDGYLIPTVADAPTFEIIAIENLSAGDTIGPRGAGEIGVNIGATAVANAAAMALGRPIIRLPLRGDALLDLLEGGV